ncbi:TonB-dependent receptor plug domain-containing protein [Rhizosaccharibacter radicis]|uniref:TonB-dependent receptor n=1 Tax=Rhizosaccharibacter radicis TaxID=2782605 RepID=A0ABT1VTX8_9PROT|nr:TonB-dependent receptor [Acetobacteraceae bacterium KSS12]
MTLRSRLLATATILPFLAPAGVRPAAAATTSAATDQGPLPGGSAAGTSIAGTSAASRSAPGASADAGEAIIVTGTREFAKKARTSLAPVDIVTSRQLRETGQPDLRDALTQLLPSLTVPTFGFDTGALTDSFSLRGLSPNETLVLVNGKRRHGTANLYSNAGPQQGSTPADIDLIPISAVDHVEVLRDGASAQYGSDAVAGVVNIILKQGPSDANIQSITGAFYKGDGFTQDVSGDKGVALGANGFLHLSGEVRHQDPTNRGAPDSRVSDPNLNGDLNKLLGTPENTREVFSANAGYDITERVQAYGFATYGHKYGQSYQNYRLPNSLPAIYPYGYSPLETLVENDWAITAGLKGDDLFGFRWDASTTYGHDYDTIGVINSANTALFASGGLRQTDFHVADYDAGQWTNNLDLSRAVTLPVLPAPLNIAFGAEQRYETYGLGAGEPNAYLSGGAQALPGLLPALAGNYSRNVYAGYIDLSTQIVPHWQVDLAGRFEHYTDAGDTETGKVSTRYDFSRRFALRATISNGFHAPTLAQEHYSNLNVSPSAASGILPTNSAAARSIGASPLKPERSTTVTGGFTAEPIDRLHVAVDVYQINLRDIITQGGQYNGAAAITALGEAGLILPAGALSNPTGVAARYFANVASTRTQGLDVTATYLTRLGQYGRIDWDAALNINRTRLTHAGTDSRGLPFLSAQNVAYLTSAYPRSKLVAGGRWSNGRWDFAFHERRVGQTVNELTAYYNLNQSTVSSTRFNQMINQPRFLTDLELGYRISDALHIALGADNAFNAVPSSVPYANRYLGVPRYYTSTSQIGINGGFYYLRLNVTL